MVISIVPCAARSKRFSYLFGFSLGKKMDPLSFLDLSNNNIQHIEGLSSKAKIMLSDNHCPLDFAPGVLREAHCLSFQKGTFLIRRLYVLIPKALHAPERSRKYHGYFLVATPGPFSKSASTLFCAIIEIRRQFLILTWWEQVPVQHSQIKSFMCES